MLITVWIMAISAMTLNGGIIGATSIPDSWPTQEACEVEAKKAEAYIKETRKDLREVAVRCVPHRKIEE